MKIKEGIPETVFEESEHENTFSEISIPDETISVTTDGNESVQQSTHLEDGKGQVNRSTNNEIETDITNVYPENGYNEKGRADSYDEESYTSDKIRVPDQQKAQQQGSNHHQNFPVTVMCVVDDSSSSGQSPLKSVNSSSACDKSNVDSAKIYADSTKIYGQNNDLRRDGEQYIIQTKGIENGFVVHRNFEDNNENSSLVVELTKENLKNHTKQMKSDPSNNKTLFQEHYKDNLNSAVSDVKIACKDLVISDKIEKEISDKSITVSYRKTSSRKQSRNYTQAIQKSDNGVSPNNTSVVTSILRSESLRKECEADSDGYHQVNDKHNMAKKNDNLEDVETLVSQSKISKTKNKQRKEIVNPEVNDANRFSDVPVRIDENADVKQGSYECDDSNNKGPNGILCYSCDEDGDLEKSENQETAIVVKEGKSRGQKRLLKRGRRHKFQRSQPVYDATNTSTSMILLNNKYGKNSRLWTGQECQLNRSKLINPLRHQKEPSFYLSGNFHARCSTSEESVRPCFTSMMKKFDFTDRPQSDKIGDRLYEAKVSVNPSRHRSCRCTLPPLTKPLNFSPPTQKEKSNRYAFAWERLYAERQLRPLSSIRPISSVRSLSSLSVTRSGVHVVKLPQAFPAFPRKETAL